MRGFCYSIIDQFAIMYRFNIIKLEEGGYKFELGSIQMLIDDFVINNGNHFLKNPQKAIAYFNINGNLYGVTNDAYRYSSAEAFYEKMKQQYMILTNKSNLLQTDIRQSA